VKRLNVKTLIQSMNGSKHSNYQENFKQAIFVMDLQPRLLANINCSTSLVEANSILLRSAQLLDVPAIITEQVPDKLGATMPEIFNHLEDPNIIQKDSFSAFGSSEFCDFISRSKINRLILTGIETSICVFLTACDAMRSGIDVTILSDCVDCRIEKDGVRCLNQLQHIGAEIIPLETFLFRHLNSSKHASFREVSGLIKSRISSP
jgi:nicotinamidase-related amidase